MSINQIATIMQDLKDFFLPNYRRFRIYVDKKIEVTMKTWNTIGITYKVLFKTPCRNRA